MKCVHKNIGWSKEIPMYIKKLLFTISIVFIGFNYLYADIVITTIKKADCNSANGSVTIKVTAGAKPYKFELIGPVNDNGVIVDETVSLNNLLKGDYTLLITDSHGCAGSKLFSIEESEMKVNVDLTASFADCGEEYNGASLLIATASGGVSPYVYSWPDGRYYTYQQGYFACTATDAHGCSKEGSIFFISFPTFGSSKDPNSIKGPDGYGKSRFVSINDELQYTVHFENDPALATAPAQRVVINIPIDKHLSPYSFSLGRYGFGKYSFEAPANRLFYQNRLDLRDSLGLYLDISTGIDVTRDLAYWIFESIDPKTGSRNTLSPDQGFLPVNDTTNHIGEGFITYKFKPKLTCQTADSVWMSANIVFDKNDAMNTGNTWNLIDALPPASNVDSIYYDPFSSRYTLSFSGKDDTLGCGVKDYNLYVSENDGPYKLYQTNIPNKEFPFLGKNETKYSFCSGARDNVNNTGVLKYKPEASIFCTNEPFLKTPTRSTSICTGMELSISWKPSNGAFIDLEFSKDNGNSFSLIASDIDAAKGVFLWKIPHIIDGTKNGLIRAINSNSRVAIDTSEVFTIRQGIIAEAGNSRVVCAGNEVTLTPAVTRGIEPYTFSWSPSGGLSSNTVRNPLLIADISKAYSLTVSDASGCIGSDSVQILVPISPDLSMNGVGDFYCLNSGPAIFAGIPENGIFSGQGITNNTFNPMVAGLGTHEIQYTYTDANSCNFSITKTIAVKNAVEVNFTGLSDRYSLQDASVILTGTPQGGVFMGSGISGNTFNPLSASIGIHDISYSYTEPDGCNSTATKQAIVSNVSIINNVRDELCTDKFELFPTTATTNIIINFSPCRPLDGVMALYDIQGQRKVVIKKGILRSEMIFFDVSDLVPGVYFIVVSADQKLSYQKFIKGSYKN